jgi:hypothetical protein
MTEPCAHRFSKITRHPTRGTEIGSGVCLECKTRLCVHDFLDKRNRAAGTMYRCTHPLSSPAISGCAICQGSPRANSFEQQRIQPWFDGDGPPLPAGWYFAGNVSASVDDDTTTT